MAQRLRAGLRMTGIGSQSGVAGPAAVLLDHRGCIQRSLREENDPWI